jgi:1-acyl-sn-glycerol-3-phosphate acyltransferase
VYALLRAIAGVALRWYYRDIQVEGLERVPRNRPLLLVVNHPNALVDALLVAWAVPRRVLITAKSTLFRNRVAAAVLRWLGVVPLRRAKDEPSTGPLDPNRNLETFRAVLDALSRGGTVLIFPEGKSHDEPSLAPLKTGAARMALQATQGGFARDLAIVPIGLTFERKDAPRTRVFVQIGNAIEMEGWCAPTSSNAADALTSEIDTRLRAVTLNYSSLDDAARAVRLSSTISALLADVPEIGANDRSLGFDAGIARRLGELEARLAAADAQAKTEADTLVRRLEAVSHVAAKHGILLEDVRISLSAAAGARFVLREGWVLLTAGPIALWGRVNHWLPFRAARLVAKRSIESAADPAMRTLVAGVAFVLATYAVQTVAVSAILGIRVGLAYLVSLPLAAEANFYLSDRFRRAARRARAFVRFRRDRDLQARLASELAELRLDVLRLDRALAAPLSQAAAP